MKSPTITLNLQRMVDRATLADESASAGSSTFGAILMRGPHLVVGGRVVLVRPPGAVESG